jgi:ATP-dependent exoDNAse (exonuclease V) alpha subunit
MIIKGKTSLDWKEKYKIGKNPKYRGTLPFEFLYGYAITCHKAQGSEWDKVLVLEEKFPFDKTEHARWLYTAVTRSSSKLVLVR